MALQMSLQETKRTAGPSTSSRPGPSRQQNGNARQGTLPADKDLHTLDQEIEDAKAQRTALDALIRTLERQREEKLQQIRSAQAVPGREPSKGKNVAASIDYTDEFDWTPALRAKMKSVFGFDSFRLCQEG